MEKDTFEQLQRDQDDEDLRRPRMMIDGKDIPITGIEELSNPPAGERIHLDEPIAGRNIHRFPIYVQSIFTGAISDAQARPVTVSDLDKWTDVQLARMARRYAAELQFSPAPHDRKKSIYLRFIAIALEEYGSDPAAFDAVVRISRMIGTVSL